MPHPVAILRRELDIRFPEWVNLGSFNCRRVRGSTRWSQHSYRTGRNGEANALDIGVGNDLALGDRIYDWLEPHRDALRLHRFSGGRHALWRVSLHFDHLHVDFDPQGTGTPHCAGGAAEPILDIPDPFQEDDMLRRGEAAKPDVERIQSALNHLHKAGLQVDGVWGDRTAAAVAAALDAEGYDPSDGNAVTAEQFAHWRSFYLYTLLRDRPPSTHRHTYTVDIAGTTSEPL